MPTFADVAQAAASSRKALREAYIRLRGVPVTLYHATTASVRDAFGDFDPSVGYTTSTIYMVIDFSKYYSLMEMYGQGAVDEDTGQALTGIVSLDTTIQLGDRVSIPISFYTQTTDTKLWQVSDVRTQSFLVPVSRQVSLVPKRD